jgi:hypothetical protein
MCALAIAGCTTRTIPLEDAALADAGREIDAGRERDAGPEIDGGIRLDDVLIYLHSRDTLYAFSPYTNTVDEIGVFRLANGDEAPFMTDLAVDSAENVFTSSDESLWRVNVTSGIVTEVGTFDIGSERLFALSFLAPDESPDGTEMLIGATNEGAYYEIDRNDGSTSLLGEYPDDWTSSGDIVSVAGFGTFATVRRPSPSEPEADTLARIEFTSSGASVVTVIGPIEQGNTLFTEIFGLGYWGRRFYGFTNDGELLEIDRDTGAATVVSQDTGAEQFWGAGVTTRVPILI